MPDCEIDSSRIASWTMAPENKIGDSDPMLDADFFG